MREVVYSSGAHAPVEYTKEQKEILEKLKLKLQCYKWAKIDSISKNIHNIAHKMY